MANPYVNKVIVNDQIKLDLTGDTVTAETLMQGYTAHDASGAPIVGTASGGSAPSFMKVYTSGNFTVAADTKTLYNAQAGTGYGIYTNIEQAVQASGKNPVNCFAVVWDGTENSSISTLNDDSFMYGAAMLNQSGTTYMYSGYTDFSVSARKSSAGASYSNSSGNIGYTGNLITIIGFSNQAYYRAGRTYNWVCIAIVQ